MKWVSSRKTSQTCPTISDLYKINLVVVVNHDDDDLKQYVLRGPRILQTKERRFVQNTYHLMKSFSFNSTSLF